MTLHQAATERYPSLTFDCALPQPFVDQIRADYDLDLVGHFVWAYPDGSVLGMLAPVTELGDVMAIKLRNAGVQIHPTDPEPPQAPGDFDEVGAIIDYEAGNLGPLGIVRLFQHLVNNGHAWSLQGHYGRQATLLIEAGYVTRP